MRRQVDARFPNTQTTMYAYTSSIHRDRDQRHRDEPGDTSSRLCIKTSYGEDFVEQTPTLPSERRYLQACTRGTAAQKAEARGKKHVPPASRRCATVTLRWFSPQPSGLAHIQRASSRSATRVPGARGEPASVSEGCAWFKREGVVTRYLLDAGRPCSQIGESRCASSTDMWQGASTLERSPLSGCPLQLQRAQKTVSQVQGYKSKKLTHPPFSGLTLPSSDPAKGVRQRRGLGSGQSPLSEVKRRHRGGSAASLRGQSPAMKCGCNTNFCYSVWRRSRSHLTYTPRHERYRIAAQQPTIEGKDFGVPSFCTSIRELGQPSISKQRSTNDTADSQTRGRVPTVQRKVDVGTAAKPPAMRVHGTPDKNCKLVPCKTGPTVMDVQRCARGGSHSGIHKKEKRGTAVYRARSSLAKENGKKEAAAPSRLAPNSNVIKDSDKGARLRASRLACYSKSRADPSTCVDTRRRRGFKEGSTDMKRLSSHFFCDNTGGAPPCDSIVTRARSTSRRPPNVPRLDLRRCKEYRSGV